MSQTNITGFGISGISQTNSNDFCLVNYNLKVEEVEFLKKTLNQTQMELNKLRINVGGGSQNSEMQRLQNIIDELNNKLRDSISKETQ